MCGGLDDVERKWAEIQKGPLMVADDRSMQVELVAADRLVWSGEATMVIARTTEGERRHPAEPRAAAVGARAGHGRRDAPRRRDLDRGGRRRVHLRGRQPDLDPVPSTPSSSHDIDLEKARPDLERAGREGAATTRPWTTPRERWAEARVRAAERRPDANAAVAVGGRRRRRPAASCCCCTALCLVVRRRWISRPGGTFELSVRVRSGRAGRGWVLGVGRYTGDDLELFRIFSLAFRPRCSSSAPTCSTSDSATRTASRPTRCTPGTSSCPAGPRRGPSRSR